jgi:hypothetical protein
VRGESGLRAGSCSLGSFFLGVGRTSIDRWPDGSSLESDSVLIFKCMDVIDRRLEMRTRDKEWSCYNLCFVLIRMNA